MFFILSISTSSIFAADNVDLYQAPLNSINKYPILQTPKNAIILKSSSAVIDNSLQKLNQTKEDNQMIVRYQQLYKGIPVIGAQVMITKGTDSGVQSNDNAEVNGHLLDNIELNTKPAISAQQAKEYAKKSYFQFSPQSNIQQETAELQIRPDHNNQLKLVYLVSFKSVQQSGKPDWPFLLLMLKQGL